MGSVGACELHIVAVLHEEVVHRTAAAEFAPLIEADILVLAIGAKSGQPAVEKLHRAFDLNALPESIPLKWSAIMR